MITAAQPHIEVPQPAFLFDLDGTLVDSVYQHVTAWQEALGDCGVPLSVWRIHRRIGMSGGLFLNALQRETGLELDAETLAQIVRPHAEHYLERVRRRVVPLPGAGGSSSAVSGITGSVRHRYERVPRDRLARNRALELPRGHRRRNA